MLNHFVISFADWKELAKMPLNVKRTLAGVPLLHLAAEAGFLSACDFLVNQRHINSVDERSKVGFHPRACCCYLKLISFGTTNHNKQEWDDSSDGCMWSLWGGPSSDEGWTPLHYACRYGRVGSV